MKITYYKINPGGNITAIVKNKLEKEERIRVSKLIMQTDSSIEQVGFWMRPENQEIVGRLEMAGGEFCGNALRAFGALLSRKGGKKKFFLESSGTEKYIRVDISNNNSQIKLPVADLRALGNKCILPGIGFLITKRKMLKNNIQKVLSKNFSNLPASGVVMYERENNIINIKPIIWVRDVNTLIEETACGSGTIALAYLMYKRFKLKRFRIQQPSGSIFSVNFRGTDVCLSGPILKIEKKFLLV